MGPFTAATAADGSSCSSTSLAMPDMKQEQGQGYQLLEATETTHHSRWPLIKLKTEATTAEGEAIVTLPALVT